MRPQLPRRLPTQLLQPRQKRLLMQKLQTMHMMQLLQR
jgi:hypothetical protein